jgi:hypothetical protein
MIVSSAHDVLQSACVLDARMHGVDHRIQTTIDCGEMFVGEYG